jgi:predicted nucleotidyltransferase
MKTSWSSLAPILRSDTQGRIFATIMLDPEAEHSLTDLAGGVGTSLPSVLREVERAEAAGIVTTRRVGRTRLVRARPAHPLYEALSRIVLGTYGPPAIIARALADVDDVDEVYLFGSWAARYLGTPGRWPNDIDVLIIGRPDRNELHEAAEQAERILGVPVEMTVRSPEQWQAGREPALTQDSFVAEVKSRPLLKVATSEGPGD